jgi:hypothetical protein
MLQMRSNHAPQRAACAAACIHTLQARLTCSWMARCNQCARSLSACQLCCYGEGLRSLHSFGAAVCRWAGGDIACQTADAADGSAAGWITSDEQHFQGDCGCGGTVRSALAFSCHRHALLL